MVDYRPKSGDVRKTDQWPHYQSRDISTKYVYTQLKDF